MSKARFFSLALAAVLALNLGVITASSADAAQGGGDLCVAVSGGTVQNATVVDVVADGGTSIADASGGRGNLAITADGGNERDRNNGNGNRNNNRNDWSAESLDVLEQRVLQTDIASAGNAGVATASADGGVVSIGDINSGGNVGNAIAIGDTVCAPFEAAPEKKPSGGGGHAAPTGGGGGGDRGGQRVRALPSTGVGELGNAESGSLILALGARGMMGLSVGSRLDRQVSRSAGR